MNTKNPQLNEVKVLELLEYKMAHVAATAKQSLTCSSWEYKSKYREQSFYFMFPTEYFIIKQNEKLKNIICFYIERVITA